MIRIYRSPVTGDTKPRQVVASFQDHCQLEANLCVQLLQHRSTTLKPGELDDRISDFRYTVEVDPPKIRPVTDDSRIMVITDKAKPTKRFIAYQLSWTTKSDGFCHCLAWHPSYGTVRGRVENSVEGRKLFTNRIKAVWPNAEISKH